MSENSESSLAEVKTWLGMKKVDIDAIDTGNDVKALSKIIERISKKIGDDKVAAHLKEHFGVDSVQKLVLLQRWPAAALSVTITRLKEQYA